MRSRFTAVASALLGLLSALPAQAAWPDDKPIELVVGFAPGGGTDLMARKLAPFLQKRLGGKAQFVVVNKPGAAGEIANAHLARATPDGYTVGIVNVPGFLFVPMVKKAQYSPDDLRLVARAVEDTTVLVTRADSRHASLPGVVESLRRQPGSVSFGHNGVGTNGDLALQLMAEVTKVQFNEIPFKGTAAQKTDLLGGHLDVAMVSLSEVPELHGGRTANVRAIAQLSPRRAPVLGQVPTATEAGVPVVMSSERGFAFPKAVPNEIALRLETAIAEALKDPEYLAADAGTAPIVAYLTGAQWNESLNHDRKALKALADRMPK